MANGIADEQATLSQGLQTTGLYGQQLGPEQADAVAGAASGFMKGIEDKIGMLNDPKKMAEAFMQDPEIQQMMGMLEQMFPDLHKKIMDGIGSLSGGSMAEMLGAGGQSQGSAGQQVGSDGQQRVESRQPEIGNGSGKPISVSQNDLPAGAGSRSADRSQAPSATIAQTFGENRGDIAREINFPNGNVPREVYLSQAADVGDHLQGNQGVGMNHDNTDLGVPNGDINLGIGHQAGMEQGIDFRNMG